MGHSPIASVRCRSPYRWRLALLEMEPSVARQCGALLGVVIALQDRLYPGIMAVGTKVVDRLHVLSGTQQDGSAGRLPQCISRKLFLAAFHLDYLSAQFNGFLTKQYVFLSRFHYLLVQIGHGSADLLHWRRLGRLKQRLQSLKRTYDRVYRAGPVSGDFERILRGVHIEIHDIAFQSQKTSRERRALVKAVPEAA